jgi:hypothetical protein
LSSFIEWAVERAVNDVTVTLNKEGSPVSAANVTEFIWDVDESDRFVNTAWAHPGLLTHNEQRKWKFICETKFWQFTMLETFSSSMEQGVNMASQREDEVTTGRFELNRPLLRVAWGLIEKHISDGEPFDKNTFHALLEKHPPSGMPVTYSDHQPTIHLLRDKLENEQDSAWTEHKHQKDRGGDHGA